MVMGVKPREVEHLISTVGSQAASDTDDTFWEELLQDPDSASSGSSDSEEDSRHAHSHSLPPANGLSSDEETFQQVTSTTSCLANVQPKRSEKMKYILFRAFCSQSVGQAPLVRNKDMTVRMQRTGENVSIDSKGNALKPQ